MYIYLSDVSRVAYARYILRHAAALYNSYGPLIPNRQR